MRNAQACPPNMMTACQLKCLEPQAAHGWSKHLAVLLLIAPHHSHIALCDASVRTIPGADLRST